MVSELRCSPCCCCGCLLLLGAGRVGVCASTRSRSDKSAVRVTDVAAEISTGEAEVGELSEG